MEVRHRTYEYTITETTTYVIQGTGTDRLSAEQDAIERFHRFKKDGNLKFYIAKRGKPKVADIR